MDRSRIDGAYLLLKRFKGRLKLFDQALEKLYNQKASKEEFEQLLQSLDKHRAEQIFNDMKSLFDSTVQQALSRLDTHRDKLVKQTDQTLTEQQKELSRLEKKYSYFVSEKMQKLNFFVDDIALGQEQIVERINNMELF